MFIRQQASESCNWYRSTWIYYNYLYPTTLHSTYPCVNKGSSKNWICDSPPSQTIFVGTASLIIFGLNIYKNDKKLLIDAISLFHPRLGYSNCLESMPPPPTAPPQIPPAVLVQQKQGTAVTIWAVGAFVNLLWLDPMMLVNKAHIASAYLDGSGSCVYLKSINGSGRNPWMYGLTLH